MKKLPYIRQGQQLTIDILNGIIKAINSSILERKEYDSMMADITRMFNSYQSKVDNFILKYQDVVDNTPGLMDLLQSYSTLASMVNGTYVASVGSVNITAAGFNIQGTMGRVQFEDEKNYAQTYPQYSSLLITEVTRETTLVYNVAPFDRTPIWIEMNAIAGPQGPQGEPGPQGPDGEPGEDGAPGQITSIKGKKASLEECLGLGVAPASGDAYVVEADNGDVTLYVYFDDSRPHADVSSWVALNNIRGPAGPQGEMAEIRIQYSNYADGLYPDDNYDGHSFMIISEDGGSTRHVIKLTPKVEFRIVDIEEKTTATTPSTEVSRTYFSASNETIINTKITIPYLRTVESATIEGNDLHLKYRGTEETTYVGRVVYDPPKIYFTTGFEDLSLNTLREGDVIINTADGYKIYSINGEQPVYKGSLQGPEGPVGPVGASFNLVGNWSAYGEVEATAGNIGNAYFLSADDDGHALGLYVSSETEPGVYDWVFAGNSQGPQGEPGETGATGPRGARITAGVAFYYDEEDNLCVPPNTSDTYKQNDLYLNTTSWDLFRVTAIDPASNYQISAVRIGNIKGLGVTNITVDEAAENLTITYSGGSTTVVPIRTIRVADTEYAKAGFVVHRTDLSAKGIFAVDNTIGAQSDPAVPASFTIWGNAANLKAPGTANAGSSPLIPRADHVHPAQTTITGLAGSATKLATARTIGLSGVTATAQSFNGTAAITIPITAVPATLLTGTASIPTTGNAGSATRLGTDGTAATATQLVLGNGKAPTTVGDTDKPIYINNGVPKEIATVANATTATNYNATTGTIKDALAGKVNISDIKIEQGTIANTVPSSKLLKESTFARVYREATEISGITYPVSITDLLNKIIADNLLNCVFVIGMEAASETKVTGLPTIGGTPQTFGTLTIIVGSDALRMRVEYSKEIGNGTALMWLGSLVRSGSTVTSVTWKQIIDDSTAQTITGIKTFATGATPLIEDAPTNDLHAVNKEHLDGTISTLQTTINGLLLRISALEGSGKVFFTKSYWAVSITATQDGNAVTTGFTGVSSKVIVMTLTEPANGPIYGYSFSGWTKDGVNIVSGSDGFVISNDNVNHTSTLKFTYGTGKDGTYQGNVTKYTLPPTQ